MNRKKKIIKKPIAKDCSFCLNKTSPNWKESEVLGQLLSPRGRILPRSYTGLCARHQKKATHAIKHARHLALLPYVA